MKQQIFAFELSWSPPPPFSKIVENSFFSFWYFLFFYFLFLLFFDQWSTLLLICTYSRWCKTFILKIWENLKSVLFWQSTQEHVTIYFVRLLVFIEENFFFNLNNKKRQQLYYLSITFLNLIVHWFYMFVNWTLRNRQLYN